MLWKYAIAIGYALAVNIFLWLYVIAFSGIYPISAKSCILVSVLSVILYFVIQLVFIILGGVLRTIGIRKKKV
jgi:hypothetical protein